MTRHLVEAGQLVSAAMLPPACGTGLKCVASVAYSGWSITGGVNFTFPANTVLTGPGGLTKTGGGFLTITNKGTTPDRLIAARSPVSLKVEVHEMKMAGSVMRMREVDGGIEIPPGATVTLKPGGYHIMFMELKAPLAQGGKVPVTLVFEKAGSIDVELKTEAAGAACRSAAMLRTSP